MLEEQIIANALLNSNAQFIPTVYGNNDENGYPLGGEDYYAGGQKLTCTPFQDTSTGERYYTQTWEGSTGVAIAPFDISKTPATGAMLVINGISGGSGNDVLWSNSFGGVLNGNDGNDILISTTGEIVLDGGNGDDILVVGMEPQMAGNFGVNFFAAWKQKLQSFNNNMTESEM